ncbi:MAG: CaiB/BaiF CoA transferase family protein [Kiloniellales bacterium]
MRNGDEATTAGGTGHRPASRALARFRVLDLTRVRSGPTAVRQLADWGADVIKVEAPESLEPDGALGAARGTPDFQNLQRNKRSLSLNLKEPDGRAIFLKLVERADVVVENFRPDVKERLGIDYPTLKAVNPRIVLASISGFGQSGPDSARPGFDQIAQGMGGLMSITGEPGRGPMRVGIPIADLCAGLFCAMGILTALLEREASGEGQWLHTSLLQAQVFMLDFQAARWLMKGEVPKQAGNDHPTSIPTGVFPTSDGHINIAVAGEAIWKRFTRAMDAPEWLTDPDFEVNAKRSRNRARMNALIAERTVRRSSTDWIAHLTAAGVPCGEINTIDKVFADPQVQHLGIATEGDSVPFGPTRFVGQPTVLERTPSRIVRRPPLCGEQTDEILSDLGYDEAAIADLRRRQIV